MHRTLRALAYAHLAFGQRNPDLYRLMFAADAGGFTDIHLDPRVQAPFLLVVDILEHGQRAGTIRPRARSARRPPAGRICMG